MSFWLLILLAVGTLGVFCIGITAHLSSYYFIIKSRSIRLGTSLALMVFFSFATGLAVAIIAGEFYSDSIAIIVIIGIFVAFLYPLIGAITVVISLRLLDWALKKEHGEWSLATKLAIGSVWFISLIVAIVIFIYVGIIGKLYDDI